MVVSQAVLTHRSGGAADTLDALMASDGTASHAYPKSETLLSAREATRNLADAAHYLCTLHGRYPGVIDLAALHTAHPAARAWLLSASEGFALERNYLTRVSVAAGPLPSTPGHAECEAALMGQRHAIETLAQSERIGCALGAAAALVLDWKAIHHILDCAAERLGVPLQPARLPDERDTRAVVIAVADSRGIERALAFGAQQVLAQHRGLWTLLEARQRAREA